uniref:Protein huluwa-like n=1 Tax=Monopterus albus TaxID=43700 RepID=A0A3Q3IY20_MONAL
MSQKSQNAPSNVTEGYTVTNLTLVVLLLIPCVVLLLLLNCFFLGYKLLVLSKTRRKQENTEEMLLQAGLQRTRRASDVAFPPLQDGRAYMSLSEPALPHPVTSSRASSRERAGVEHRIQLQRPDGATGSGSLKASSTIRATSSQTGFTSRLGLPSGSRTYSVSKAGWCRSAPVLPQSSDSETEIRLNLVPPNTPTFLNTSAVGPGLDSDFGASAVSLRILSTDSDGLSNGVLASALEWDYYDPYYVKQNNIPKHQHHRPAVHTKQ